MSMRQAMRLTVVGLVVAGIGSALLVSRAQPPAADAALEPLVSIMELMQLTITPATNQLWSAYNEPSTPAAWRQMEEAASTLLAASSLTAAGGTGEMDREWVQNPAWQAYNEAMIVAGRAALAASRAQDVDGLLAAGDILLAPCEGCHQQFNPAVTAGE
jgi:cytochrome c556